MNYTGLLCTTVSVTCNPQQGRSVFWKWVPILRGPSSQTPALLLKYDVIPSFNPEPECMVSVIDEKAWLYIRLQAASCGHPPAMFISVCGPLNDAPSDSGSVCNIVIKTNIIYSTLAVNSQIMFWFCNMNDKIFWILLEL